MGKVSISLGAMLLVFLMTLIPALSMEQPGTGFSTAMELQEGSYNFYMEGARPHFFKIWLNTNQILHVVLRLPADIDLDLYFLNPEREVVESSTLGRGRAEKISYQASSTGYHYVIVVPYFGARGLYSLQTSIHDPPIKTATTTVTRMISVYEVVSKPVVMVETVTKTIYETEREMEVRYIESMPWTMIGLIILSASIIVSSAIIARLMRTGRNHVP